MTTTTPLSMVRDITGAVTFGLAFCDQPHKYCGKVSVNLTQELTVPDDASQFLAVFSFEPGASVYVANNTLATIAGGTFATTNSDLNPNSRLVKAGDVLSFTTSDTTAQVWVAFYAISN